MTEGTIYTINISRSAAIRKASPSSSLSSPSAAGVAAAEAAGDTCTKGSGRTSSVLHVKEGGDKCEEENEKTRKRRPRENDKKK